MVLLRPDLWPVGDIALAESVGEVKGLGRRPDAAEMAELGEAWRPWRSVAARLFWHDYLARRGRAGVTGAVAPGRGTAVAASPAAGVRSRPAGASTAVTSHTDLPANVRRLVDEIEIRDRRDRRRRSTTSPGRTATGATARRTAATAGSRRPSARS